MVITAPIAEQEWMRLSCDDREIKTDALKRHEGLKTIYQVQEQRICEYRFPENTGFRTQTRHMYICTDAYSQWALPVLSGVCTAAGALSYIYYYDRFAVACYNIANFKVYEYRYISYQYPYILFRVL